MQPSLGVQFIIIFSNPVGAYPFDLEFTEDCGILIVSNKGKPTKEGSQYRDPEGTLTKIQLGADFSDATPIVSSTISFSDYFRGDAGLFNYRCVPDSNFKFHMFYVYTVLSFDAMW